MNYAFLLAGGASVFALVIHLLLGRSRPPPSRGAGEDAHDAVDAAFGRHAVSIILAMTTLAFAEAARSEAAHDLALAATAVALLLAALRAGLGVWARLPRHDVDEWGLTALAGALGLIGLQI